MPVTCIVVNCGSRADRDKLSFFSVPKALNFPHATHLNELSAQRRQQWIKALKRKDLTESILRCEKVCSKHFISGKPADLKDINHPDWVPNHNMGYCSGQDLKRKSNLAGLKLPENYENIAEGEAGITNEERVKDTSTQTDLTGDDLARLPETLAVAENLIDELSQKLNTSMFSYQALESDQEKCLFYTGLKFPLLRIVYDEIKNFIPTSSVSSFLEPLQQYVLTLIKLGRNLDFEDLAYRFGISKTLCSSCFNLIIAIMYQRFRSLIIWPEDEILGKTMPSLFKEVFNDKTVVIIDCFEVFIKKPSIYLAQQQCWSHYAHHWTVKFLVGFTPQGTVSYIGKSWGGRASNKHLVESSGFLDKIKPQDVILTDKSFLVDNSLSTLSSLQTKLVVPAFKKENTQLISIEIQNTRNIEQLRIHIEKVIGSIKSKFTIFSGSIPVTMLTSNSKDDLNILDQIVVVTCALVNLSPPVVPL